MRLIFYLDGIYTGVMVPGHRTECYLALAVGPEAVEGLPQSTISSARLCVRIEILKQGFPVKVHIEYSLALRSFTRMGVRPQFPFGKIEPRLMRSRLQRNIIGKVAGPAVRE